MLNLISTNHNIYTLEQNTKNSIDGINFGIVSSAGAYNPNGGLASDPLIQDSLVFVLSGATGLTVDDVSNVSFQYGTSFDEPIIPPTGGPPAAIPVPAAVWLFGSGLLGLVGVARRRKIS